MGGLQEEALSTILSIEIREFGSLNFRGNEKLNFIEIGSSTASLYRLETEAENWLQLHFF